MAAAGSSSARRQAEAGPAGANRRAEAYGRVAEGRGRPRARRAPAVREYLREHIVLGYN
ncbi:hypothetical protein [Amycolatopsis sp. CA-126428]|uniref:hypothetical protein n=1 Tax=Amycolatopsis sp. CA-126428 TaxID=2073158 RepID=UPI001304ED77|nr:hypothetical protein [Amycolatopsis sp. CA-126428]